MAHPRMPLTSLRSEVSDHHSEGSGLAKNFRATFIISLFIFGIYRCFVSHGFLSTMIAAQLSQLIGATIWLAVYRSGYLPWLFQSVGRFFSGITIPLICLGCVCFMYNDTPCLYSSRKIYDTKFVSYICLFHIITIHGPFAYWEETIQRGDKFLAFWRIMLLFSIGFGSFFDCGEAFNIMRGFYFIYFIGNAVWMAVYQFNFLSWIFQSPQKLVSGIIVVFICLGCISYIYSDFWFIGMPIILLFDLFIAIMWTFLQESMVSGFQPFNNYIRRIARELSSIEINWNLTSKQIIRLLTTVEITTDEETSHSTCAVCLNEFKVTNIAAKLHCLHIYHVECIAKWLEKEKTCPMCRRTVQVENTGKYKL